MHRTLDTVPTWKIPKQGTLITDYMTSPFYWLDFVYWVTSVCWPEITKQPCSFARSPRHSADQKSQSNLVLLLGAQGSQCRLHWWPRETDTFSLGLFKGHPFLQYFFLLFPSSWLLLSVSESHTKIQISVDLGVWKLGMFQPQIVVPQSIKSKASLKVLDFDPHFGEPLFSCAPLTSHIWEGDMSCRWKCCGRDSKITGPLIGNILPF